MRRLSPLLLLASLAACPAQDDPVEDSPVETDTDTDADSDTDADADTDADSDTDTDADTDADCSTTPVSGTDITWTTVMSGLSAPTFVTHAGDGSGRLFATTQAGTIVERAANGTTRTYLDIRSIVRDGGERGLLSMAFHPDFATNGRLYVYYTDNDSDTVVSEFTAATPATSLPPTSSERIVLTQTQPASNHNGGQIAFGDDGYLYIGLGDGGGADDTFANGQRENTFLAKILRIDVNAGTPYNVPSDNPFIGVGSHMPETWVWGLRNPWRFSFDRSTGELYIGDVGQDDYEEIHVAEAGDNLGWPIMEGDHCFNGANCDSTGLTRPIWEYAHTSGVTAVVGGYVYRGCALPDLDGIYFFSDAPYSGSSPLRTLDLSGASAVQGPIWQSNAGALIVSFGEDEEGELYVADAGSSRILKMTPGN
ncbi:MAG: PQQ-dependent sugar dehydrogenase [Proteobacteria bacterium]|nr:PQQ-dependent sugar dehydrogenase [Pseudomonadota bacterium]